ncbi:Permease of the drug/metabolite transporter (DMT) superfamily [Nitrincola lacisaponensis]|uniref:Permease of the drug/metabolite transporter (DMT) superfamily n=1 Tax=Nitrincola lacisaponensis TaxID=267850 RepID=A0A063XXD6_9GAMM|nr:drug/metabolite transporter [Nitrincola lacisaponensis]KDE38848.1 Permease of the drug/metabolite transporter (DMT) superfamily [Nitrincola lacisaponensis]
MSSLALVLVLVSACLHAGWNLLGKKQVPSLAFFTLAMLGGALLFMPVLGLSHQWMQLPGAFWWLLILSGAFQGIYMAGLAWAYARGEISVLYPLARALPVLLVPVAGWFIWQHWLLNTQDILGMVLIALAGFMLPLIRPSAFSLSIYWTPALGFMLLAALGTVGYSLTDKAAIDLMRQQGFSAMLAGMQFMVLQAWAALVWMLPVIACLPAERQALRHLLSGPARVWILAGAMILTTYGLVLIAMAYTEDVSYLVALRQASIPIGALLGVFWLKETLSAFRWLALTVMMTGLVLVALN